MPVDAAYFFDGGGRREAIDAIFAGVHRAEAVLLLVGASGSGRSAVLARFVAEADPDALAVALLNGDILMNADQALWALAGQLDADSNRGSARDALFTAIDRCRAEGRNVALLLDDAHELGEETRAAVVAVALEAGVGLVLAGDETLAPMMDPAVPFSVVTLRPLTEDETETFVAGWLAVQDEDELPSHRTISRLYRHSAGMPGRLAGLVGGGSVERSPLLPNGIPVWHAVLAVVAVALLGWLIAEVTRGHREDAPTATEISVSLPASGTAPPPEAVPTATPVPRVSVAAVPQPIEVREPAVYVSTDVKLPPQALADAAASQPSPMPSSSAPGSAATPARIAGAPAAANAVPSATAPAAPSSTAATSPSASAPGARLTAIPARTDGNKAAPGNFSADETALLGRRPSQYTLQVFASFNEEAVRNFVAAHPGIDQTRVFRTRREGLAWFVVVMGDFRNRDDARATISGMPADVQKLRPWARSLQGIQDELRRRGE